ncbi:endo-1,4-beta-xylanase [Tuwongella immobilis]|uniref:GH10 domain-containing protein n=1 Tax=Tuwongella immobilis TaxID=692036 RepID=A0A6C2YJ23_9BACT|nr:endo-1,4-beta-xylanase [Tuwongella immobilis]VIP01548.1 glycoside hydrolase family 10 : Glycoside hydrolase family 10 OS=Planctomyces limnophilus (strain ATCC 43296 / DSM 3776 / IFAM 1008 / 290) GN=Plim_3847 PE=4 SV=1: Glyco_hydro_10 [Tuwongella immobilis]VTR98736.1 glycoside hydrolase family 10 : Glycoside hydrolase family 10 OS=Planctomyces limnophilus (strain ATCC 43296 / DSM 3776 / IFAM 1008 / 290) GN=Plim_3847 PE=4 SV=1: Glyco_hydro_10 [Tuwongella immobilis]
MMSFHLPRELSTLASDACRYACIAGGYDHTPSPTQVRIQNERLTVSRELDESGYLQTPWLIEGAGLLMNSTATLMDRPTPYQLQVELARGKLNQVRNQVSEWKHVGLQTSPEMDESLKQAINFFGKAVLCAPSAEADVLAMNSMKQSFRTAELLINLYVHQLFDVRRQRQPKLDSVIATRLRSVPNPTITPQLTQTLNAVNVPFTWKTIEPSEYNFNWTTADAIVEWATTHQMPISAGPLIDLSVSGLPEWLLAWRGDYGSLTSFICDYVETVIHRYRDRIRRFTLISAGNSSEVLGLSDDDQVRLTARVVEAAMNIDPDLQLVLGIAQPWGDYMTSEDHTYSPFVFADTLLRAGLQLSALELEWLMGCSPRGSFCRDLLEASRQLDLFALLGVPLQVALSYPSSRAIDPNADPHQQLAGAGYWHTGFTPDVQAEWAYHFSALALAKPAVWGVTWDHLCDSEPHLTPHGGLLDMQNRPKPALARLKQVRDTFLG